MKENETAGLFTAVLTKRGVMLVSTPPHLSLLKQKNHVVSVYLAGDPTPPSSESPLSSLIGSRAAPNRSLCHHRFREDYRSRSKRLECCGEDQRRHRERW